MPGLAGLWNTTVGRGHHERESSQPATAWILSTLDEAKTYLVGEIVQSTGVLRGEIQTLATWTARVEHRLEFTTEAHNLVINRLNYLKARVHAADLALEDMGNCSRRINVRIRGIPERAGEGPLADLVVHILQPLLPGIPQAMSGSWSRRYSEICLGLPV
ncbi:Hypothetical predicted protein [Pelobates cultripes]|uniref:Uncharacterized protein n=1 Tax=Pelobates cultripes TaxID=61616 RepID=A0AAD1WZ18_PELCU|nr:Hypothetical predicted protein [Pelobates cultripes]